MLAFSITPPERDAGSDARLEAYLAGIAAGDQHSLALLYNQTRAAVYGFALSLLKNPCDAEDAAHDTYLHIWRAAGSYTAQGKPLAWIFTITRRLALMRLREQARLAPLPDSEDRDRFAHVPAVDATDRLLLEALLDNLSDEERQIVVLHAMTGLKHREIAEILDLPLSTVLSKYNRALKKLRSIVKEEATYA